MSEYIKKEDTIEYLNDLFGEMYHVSFGDVLRSIDSLQTYSFSDSAENKGEWIAYDHGMGLVYLKCPFCGTTIDKRYVEHNFCGKCRAILSGEKSGFER